MAYEKTKIAFADKVCLYGGLAEDFMRCQVGQRMTLTMDVLITGISMGQADYVDGGDTPAVEFEVLDVQGAPKGKKNYDEMDNEEMEAEIHGVKFNDDPDEPPTGVSNREDGGSIWVDMKRQEKIGRQSQRRPRPFRMG